MVLSLKEESNLGERASFGDYSTRKAKAEYIYKRFARKRHIKLTIFRPTYLLGKNNYFDRENYYFSRILKDKKILIPGNGNALIQFAFLKETTQIFADYPKLQRQDIEMLNIGSDEYISVKGFVELCEKVAGRKPKILEVDLKKHNLTEERFYDDPYPFPNLSIILDNSKLKKECSICFTSLEEGLRDIYIQWKRNWNGNVQLLSMGKELLEKIEPRAVQ